MEDEDILVEEREGDVLYYIRDESGELVGVMRNGEIYYYQKNYQGDIEGIYDSSYKLIVKYSYDAYGNVLSIEDNEGKEITDNNHIGRLNPYRYRSYYYDEETNLYYLKSRYYNPLWGRFINADCILGGNSKHLGYNLFVYSNNNPIFYKDEDGYSGVAIAAGGLALGPVAGMAVGVIAVGALAYGTGLLIASVARSINISGITTAISFENYKKKNKTKKKDKSKHTVYAFHDPKEDEWKYVGRTNDIDRRKAEHDRTPREELKMYILRDDLTKIEARTYEQFFIEYFQTLNKKDKLMNQRNEVRIGNPFYKRYVDPLKGKYFTDYYVETYVGE